MITKETNPNDTIVYSKNNCVKCKQTKMLLNRENIPYIEVADKWTNTSNC